MKLIECKKLNIGYNGKSVCKDISFAIEKGQYVCIVGENGSGKSTMLKTILGLNKAISGKVIYDKELKMNSIGYLPQQTEFQKDFPATVMEIVMSGFLGKMGWRPFYRRGEKDKANRMLMELGIANFANKSYKELSGGQQQKVLLARALCATDEMLIMDEPVNGLDAKSIKGLYSLLKKLNKEKLILLLLEHIYLSLIESIL